jgi:hypothetical protein
VLVVTAVVADMEEEILDLFQRSNRLIKIERMQTKGHLELEHLAQLLIRWGKWLVVLPTLQT